MSTETRRFSWALALSAATLTAVLAAWAHRHATSPWKVTQQQFVSAAADKAGPVGEIREARTCEGTTDRCTTCHLGADRADLKGLPVPFGPHGPGNAGHEAANLGCSACHGGSPRALDDSAHLRPGSSQRDPLLSAPHVQASCGRCHVPGSVAGDDQLRRGATLYVGLGCVLCHPVATSGKGGLDYGPDLAAVGRRSLSALRTSLFEPEADFAGSTMPSFRLALEPEPLATESLYVYLESLPLHRSSLCGTRDRTAALVHGPCTDCHAGLGGAANGRFVHRCPFILERREQLACAACHPGDIPTGSRDCPVVAAQRSGCPVCHDAAAVVPPQP